jgi:hypothetical protein
MSCVGNTKAHKIALYDTFAVFYAEYCNFFSISYIALQRKYSLTFQVKLSTAYPQQRSYPATYTQIAHRLIHSIIMRTFDYLSNLLVLQWPI